jgi:hypothetical protein
MAQLSLTGGDGRVVILWPPEALPCPIVIEKEEDVARLAPCCLQAEVGGGEVEGHVGRKEEGVSQPHPCGRILSINSCSYSFLASSRFHCHPSLPPTHRLVPVRILGPYVIEEVYDHLPVLVHAPPWDPEVIRLCIGSVREREDGGSDQREGAGVDHQRWGGRTESYACGLLAPA